MAKLPTPPVPHTPESKPGRKSGYAEPQPRDANDARQPDPRKSPDPDEGGLGRKSTETPDTADDD